MYIQVNNQNIYYQKVGKGKNLILLHGWKQDVSSFWGVVEQLKDQFTIWLVDLPGFGRSDAPKSAFSVSDYADTINEFIKQLKIDDPTLLGHSVGGRIGIKLAAKYPNTLNKLILEDSAGIRPKRDLPKIIFYTTAKIFKYLVPNIFNLKEKLRVKFYKSLESDYLTAGELKETFTKVLNEDLTVDLPKVKTNTLLIWGEKDPTLEASLKNGRKMYQLIENSKLAIIENVGHFPHLENPERFIYYVKDFI
jgi:pimeloyl-ACP methyl ester carboxylesterase